MKDQPINMIFEGSVHNAIGHNEGGIHNYAPVQQQSLPEAVAEIQDLLKQLQQSDPTTTTAEQMIVARKAIERIESDPTLKQRVINAAKEGSLAAFDKALDNPVGALIINVIKGWMEA